MLRPMAVDADSDSTLTVSLQSSWNTQASNLHLGVDSHLFLLNKDGLKEPLQTGMIFIWSCLLFSATCWAHLQVYPNVSPLCYCPSFHVRSWHTTNHVSPWKSKGERCISVSCILEIGSLVPFMFFTKTQ